MVEVESGRTSLAAVDGRTDRLMLTGAMGDLRALDDHLVEVDGRRLLGSLTVTSFRALEGPHGMPIWLGPVQRLGSQVGIADLASGEIMMVDEAAADELVAHLGERVAAEAYVDGHLHLTVLHWVALEP